MLEQIKTKRLTMAELFSITTQVYKQNFKTIFFVGFLILVPLFVIQNIIFSKAMDSFNAFMGIADQLLYTNAFFENGYYINYLIYILIVVLIELVVQPLATVTMIYGGLNIVKGEKKSIKENFLYGFLKVPAVVWTNFLVGFFLFSMATVVMWIMQLFGNVIVLLLLLFVLAILFIYVTTMWCFTDHVVAIQNLSGIRALEASSRAVKNSFAQIFGYIFFFFVITNTILFTIGKGTDILYYQTSYSVYIIVSAVFYFIETITITGFFSMFMTVLFLNRIWGTENTTIILQKYPLQQEVEKRDMENSKTSIPENTESAEQKEVEQKEVEQKEDISQKEE